MALEGSRLSTHQSTRYPTSTGLCQPTHGSARGECPEQPLDQIDRRGWTAGDLEIDRDESLDRAMAGIGITELAAIAGTGASGDHVFGSRCGAPGAAQRGLHVARDHTGDQQDIGMPWRGDEMQTEAFQIMVRVGEGMDLQLAGIAGADVDMPDRETPTETRIDLATQLDAKPCELGVIMDW